MTDNNILLELEELKRVSLADLDGVQDEGALQAWKVANLGRSAPVMLVFSRLPQFA